MTIVKSEYTPGLWWITFARFWHDLGTVLQADAEVRANVAVIKKIKAAYIPRRRRKEAPKPEAAPPVLPVPVPVPPVPVQYQVYHQANYGLDLAKWNWSTAPNAPLALEPLAVSIPTDEDPEF